LKFFKNILKSIETHWISFLSKLINSLSYIRDKYKNKVIDKNDFFDLCAVDNIKEKKCGKLLKWGLENYKVKNIAVSGPYGSGKTSFLKSFENNHMEYKYLNVSLASFKEDEHNEKKIEENILQQILYKVSGNKMPFSRIKRIKEISKIRFFFWALFLYLWINLIYVLFPIEELKTFNLFFFPSLLSVNKKFIILTFIILTLILVYNALIFFKSFNLTIKALNSEIQLSNNDDASIFYTYLDEIIYFFKKTKYNVIFFEDIDRFEKINLDLFTKLRELNNLLNESEEIKRPINFIYAVKDDLFEEQWVENKKEIDSSDKLRTKFFDLIVPIIPVVNVSNSYEKIISKLKLINNLAINSEFESDLRFYSYYIGDMRLINNIYNEFLVYKDNLIEINKISLENQLEFCRILFAFIVYKNKYPNDFSELHFNRGMINECFKEKENIVSSKIEELNKLIIEKETCIENIKKENLQSLKELRMIFIFDLWRQFPFATKFENTDINILIDNEENFKKIQNSSNIKYIYNGTSRHPSNIGFTKLEGNLKINYSERAKNIENKKSERLEKIKLDIENFKHQIGELKNLSLYEFLYKYGLNNNLPKKVKNDKLLVYFLENNLIQEKSYKNYISYFYCERLSREDYNFIESVRMETFLEPTYKLVNFNEIMKDLNLSDFRKKEILNYDLMDEIIQKKSDYKIHFENLFELINSTSNKLIDILYEYTQNTRILDKVQAVLVKEINQYWEIMIEKSNFANDKIEQILINIFKYANIDDLINQNTNSNISNFFFEKENSVEILEIFNSNDSDKTIEFITKLNIKVKYLNAKSNTEIFKYLYENKLYEISIDNIYNIARILFEDYEEVINNLKLKNYSTIMERKEFEFLLKNIYAGFNQYIKNIVLKLDSNIYEKEESVLDIINDKEEILSIDLKKEVITKQKCIYENISLITNSELWKIIIEQFKIKAKWENIILYYIYKEQNIDETLLKILNSIEFSKKLFSEKIYNIKTFEEETSKSLSTAIIKCKNLTIESFKYLLKSLYSYDHIELEEILEDKINCMLDAGYFNITSEMIDEFKNCYPKKLILLLESKIDELIDKDKFDECNKTLEDDDYIELFNSKSINKDNKKELLKLLKIEEPEKSPDLFNIIKDFIKELDTLKDFENKVIIKFNSSNLLPTNNEVIEILKMIDENEKSTELTSFIENNSNSILNKIKNIDFDEALYLILFKNLSDIQDKDKFVNDFDKSILTVDSLLIKEILELITNLDKEKIKIPFETLNIIINNITTIESKILVINSQIEFLKEDEIKDILKKLETPYNELTYKKQVLIEDTDINENLLKKLKSRDIVSSYKLRPKENYFDVYLKKRFYKADK